jgi:hypothetical protein
MQAEDKVFSLVAGQASWAVKQGCDIPAGQTCTEEAVI